MKAFQMKLRFTWDGTEQIRVTYGYDEHHAMERQGVLPEQGSDYEVVWIRLMELPERRRFERLLGDLSIDL